MKIQELERKVEAAAEAARKNAEADRRDELDKAKLQEQMNAAAEAGDLPLYRKLKEQITEIEDAGVVRRAHFKKISASVTKEEVTGAWGAFASDYGKQLSSKKAAFEKHMKAAEDAYREMVECQHNAFAQRQKLAGYIGLDPVSMGQVNPELERVFPMPYLASGAVPVDDVSVRVGGLGILEPVVAWYICRMGYEKATELSQAADVRKVLDELRNHLVR